MGKPILLTLALLACAPAVAVAPPESPAAPDTTITEPERPLPAPTALVVSPYVLNNLAWQYAFWQETEWAACLQGVQRADTLYVTHMLPAWIENAQVRSVQYACFASPTIVGFLHSHTMIEDNPANRCSFSDVDERDRARRWADMPQLLVEVVVCGPDAYLFLLRGAPAAEYRTMPAVRQAQ